MARGDMGVVTQKVNSDVEILNRIPFEGVPMTIDFSGVSDTDAETGEKTVVTAGETARALEYEMRDMEAAILEGKVGVMRLSDSRDVMKIMTQLRREWGMTYPEEE